MESSITSTKRQQLVDLVMKKLNVKYSASLETLKLQIGYDTSFVQHEYERQTQTSQMTHESNRLIDEVLTCETRGANDFEGITLLYKKIFHFLLHKSKTKNASTSAIEREVAAALESVLPRAGLRPFVALTTPEKVSQLCELANIVQGIRLFNQNIGKGGAGLESFEDLVSIVGKEGGLSEECTTEVYEVVGICENYSAFFSAGDENIGMKKEEYDNLKEQMTNRRQ